jgi:hypothetical protein
MRIYLLNCYSFLSSFVGSVFLALFGPLKIIGDSRSPFDILSIPIINCFQAIFKTFNQLILKELSWKEIMGRYLTIVLQLLITKSFILFFCFCQTKAGITFISIFSLFGVLMLQYVRFTAEDGFFYDSAELLMLCSFVLFMGVFLSSVTLGFMAKFPFTRNLLIATLGELSYKTYVGSNPGDRILRYSGICLVGVGVLGGFYGVVETVDAVIRVNDYKVIAQAAKDGGWTLNKQDTLNHFDRTANPGKVVAISEYALKVLKHLRIIHVDIKVPGSVEVRVGIPKIVPSVTNVPVDSETMSDSANTSESSTDTIASVKYDPATLVKKEINMPIPQIFSYDPVTQQVKIKVDVDLAEIFKK